MPSELKDNILVVVDDDPLILQSVVDYFEPENKVFSFNSAETCLQGLGNVPKVDVFIIDYVLPGLNGVQLFRIIGPKYPRAKFICITGHMSFAMAESAKQMGFDALVLKPFDLRILDQNARGMAI
jgi:DNA-binding NtrC family response regulator